MSIKSQSLSFRARTKSGMSLAQTGSFRGAAELIDLDVQWQRLEDVLVHLSTPEDNLRKPEARENVLPHYAEWRRLRGLGQHAESPLKNERRSWDLVPATPRPEAELCSTADRIHQYRDAKLMYLRLVECMQHRPVFSYVPMHMRHMYCVIPVLLS